MDLEQQSQLRRVRANIGSSVMAFLRERGVHGTFHAKDLHEYVGTGVAPASADRILRALRKDGLCDYEVVSRAGSFYRVAWLKE